MRPPTRRPFAVVIVVASICTLHSATAQDAPALSSPSGERIPQFQRGISDLRRSLSGAESLEAGNDASGIQQTSDVALSGSQVAGQIWQTPQSDRSRYPTVDWSGFLQLDGGWILQDEQNIATLGVIDPAVGLRRVRLRAFGDIRPDTRYVVDLDFAASGHPSFRDVFLGFRNVPGVQNAAFGYYKQPFSMDGESSGQELLLLERQSPFAFVPFRQTGFGVNGTDQHETITYSGSLYTFPTNSFGVGTGDGLAASTRLTVLPFVDDASGRLIHLGIGYSIGNPSDSTVEYQAEPGFFVVDPAAPDVGPVPPFVDTGAIPTRLFQLLNFEFAMAWGPFRWQSETRFAFVDQIGGPGLAFSGSYFQLGLILTGERPDYDRSRAVFHRVVPDKPFDFSGGGGAWELAAGWSVIDLDDRNITGGKMYAPIVGLNWYLSEFTRFMLNLSPIVLDDPAFGTSHAFLIGTRVQASF